MMKRSLLIASLVAVAPVVAGAQQKKSAPKQALDVGQACRMSPSADWVKRQAEWFDDSKHEWKNESLRTALLAAAGLTAPLTAPVQRGVQIEGKDAPLGPTAPAMIEHLRKLAATRGSEWPTKSVVGAAGVHAVYLLAQSDTGLGRSVLHRLMEAGPTESPAADVATFEDRLRLVWGRKQIYGTQFRVENGSVVLAPMEDSAHADLRREGAALPPFALGLCFAKTVR
jgi:hypothetical protein